MPDERALSLDREWFENLCGDKACEEARLEAALLTLKGHASDHKYYARVVEIGKQEIAADQLDAGEGNQEEEDAQKPT